MNGNLEVKYYVGIFQLNENFILQCANGTSGDQIKVIKEEEQNQNNNL
jgi:hypothetical protein